MAKEVFRPRFQERFQNAGQFDGLSHFARQRASDGTNLPGGTAEPGEPDSTKSPIDRLIESHEEPYYPIEILRTHGLYDTDVRGRGIITAGMTGMGKSVVSGQKNPMTREEVINLYEQTEPGFKSLLDSRRDARERKGGKRWGDDNGADGSSRHVGGTWPNNDSTVHERRKEGALNNFTFKDLEIAAGLVILLTNKNWNLLIGLLRKTESWRNMTDDEANLLLAKATSYERKLRGGSRRDAVESFASASTQKIIGFINADDDRKKAILASLPEEGQFLLELYAQFPPDDAAFYARNFHTNYTMG